MSTVQRVTACIASIFVFAVLGLHVLPVTVHADQKLVKADGPAWLFDERKIGHEGWTELMDASQKGDISRVERLLMAGAKVEETDLHGVTPVYAAALGGQVKVIELLLAKGADVNSQVEGGRTPLTGATWKGHLPAMRVLLKYGANANATKDDGTTPLMQASLADNQEALQLLISKGATVNHQDHKGGTALIWAAEKGNDKSVELLLQAGASAQLKTKENVNALYIAAQNGHHAVTCQLLEKGANAEEKSFQGDTPLHVAAQNGHEAVVAQLLQAGISVNEGADRNTSALLVAALFGHAKVVQLLLDRGADPNLVTDDKGQSPLEMAAVKGHAEIVRILLSKGARINSKNLADMTPLFQASKEGHEEVVRLLLSEGADPNIGSLIGTPLQYASANGHVGIVNALIEKGANPKNKSHALGYSDATTLVDAAKAPGGKALKALLNQGNPKLITPSSLALALLEVVSVGDVEKTKMLLDKGADPNARNVWMQTPLIVAAERGHIEVSELLISYGADMTAKDREERLSATEIAVLTKDRETVSMAGYSEEDKKDTLERYDRIVPLFVEAEKARRAQTHIRPRLILISNIKGCSLSTLDSLSEAVTPWTILKTCPDEMFVSDQPGSIILRTKNKLEVFLSQSPTTISKPITLPIHDKKSRKPLFQIAGHLADGRLAVGYRERPPRKGIGPEWKWTLYAYSEGKWVSIEQRDCFTPAWCLLTPFSGRSAKTNWGDEDWLWHPYLRLNPYFSEEGAIEKGNAEYIATNQADSESMDGYLYKQFKFGGTPLRVYYSQSVGPIYQTGEQRYQISDVTLVRSSLTPIRLNGDFNRASLEGKYLLWPDGLQGERPRLRLMDLERGVEPIKEFYMAAWVYWGSLESDHTGDSSSKAMQH